MQLCDCGGSSSIAYYHQARQPHAWRDCVATTAGGALERSRGGIAGWKATELDRFLASLVARGVAVTRLLELGPGPGRNAEHLSASVPGTHRGRPL